ncbi:MAG: hypothetical protein R2705_20550 [Ilumatobacteraceae bacterium]
MIPRLRLQQQLEQRWLRPLTLVHAGAGHGKSTLLRAAPSTMNDIPWVGSTSSGSAPRSRCRPARPPHRAAVDRELDGSSIPHDRLVDALFALAPEPISPALDDLHAVLSRGWAGRGAGATSPSVSRPTPT